MAKDHLSEVPPPGNAFTMANMFFFLKWKMIQFIHLFLNSCQNLIRNTVIHRVHGISQFSLYKSTEALSKADHVNEHRVDLTLVVVTKTVEKYSSVQQKPKISMKHPSL